jgi:hypothetical protein
MPGMVRYVFGLVVGVSVAAAAFMGCGSGSSCESAGAALCQRAATCSGDGTARLLSPIGDAGDSFATITFMSESDCENLYKFSCGQQGSSMVDFGACEMAADKAPCGSSNDGKGVISPAACNN